MPPLSLRPRLILIFTVWMLSSSGMVVQAESVKVGAISEEIATNRALAKVPLGKEVTETSCIEVGTAGHPRHYRCTVTWE